ncbi:uncharacterized protein CANTADRAFT_26732 [Suhomyces tanzawaensis NRRL Y-17324]|uniref:Uncharacterized protein n=1 Tax=Suhomyces tanzawaensis NRRL Y-17324 TaxID=984487 RepID=A0A1E4SH40_9ASCO|nr:uncharacterized protein CANTADRAFT_26732 [Suhomyces tanzawaensis NRRL Y-17324]ODV78795.1 hypothetical protein CANTADRAFT_26732 [Suhomyces tanzawaensis NRRL Y-17324]
MSRLDLILSFVDALDARSDRLLDSVEQSTQLISRIMAANEHAALLDSQIDDIRELMDTNSALMSHFGNLYEKSFYLESNMHVNDHVTNQTSFETLTQEYRYLVGKLQKNDMYSGATASHETPRAPPGPKEDQIPALVTKSSLANLKLKPIRCNSKRVYKKKSRYRLSGLFNINPIAYDDEESNYTKTPTSSRFGEPSPYKQNGYSEVASPSRQNEYRHETRESPSKHNEAQEASLSKHNDFGHESLGEISSYNDYRHESLGEISSYNDYRHEMRESLSKHDRHKSQFETSPSKDRHSPAQLEALDISHPPRQTSITSVESNVMENIDSQHQDDHTVASSPSEEYSSLGLRLRSNSLPETPASANVFTRLGTMKHTNILSEFDTEIAEEKLRFHRLKHFITFGNLQEGDHFKHLHNDYSKSPTRPVVSAINLDDHTDFDNLSMVSDISDYSPERTDSAFEDGELNDFEKYLRGSRFDLNNAFPHLYKSNSQDSVFQAYTRFPQPSAPSSYKFHNPAENIQLSTSNTVMPTIEQIHFSSQRTSRERESSKVEDPKKILSDVIMRNDQSIKKPTVSTPESSPSKLSKNSFSLFNFTLNSPKKQAAIFPERRKSIDNISKSLTDSFLSLVNTSQSKSHTSTPEKIRQLKIQAKEAKPIRIKSDYQVKRMPIRIPRNDGCHSKLTIGPNHTKVINHGESSMFKKPLITKISHNSLREALSGSLT